MWVNAAMNTARFVRPATEGTALCWPTLPIAGFNLHRAAWTDRAARHPNQEISFHHTVRILSTEGVDAHFTFEPVQVLANFKA